MTLLDEIIIRAPLIKIFGVASNLLRWPEFLPHYRYNRFTSQTPSGGVVRMSCVSSRVAVKWISVYRIDTEHRELHFHHVKSTLNATRGMKIVWDFEELPDGFVRVRIKHDLEVKRTTMALAPATWIAGRFLIHDIAAKTLAGLKYKAEAQEYLRAVPVR